MLHSSRIILIGIWMAFESNQMHLNQMQVQMQMSTIQMQMQMQMRPPRGIQMQVQMQMPHLHLQVQMHLHLNTSLVHVTQFFAMWFCHPEEHSVCTYFARGRSPIEIYMEIRGYQIHSCRSDCTVPVPGTAPCWLLRQARTGTKQGSARKHFPRTGRRDQTAKW